jgi:hypothetical protein
MTEESKAERRRRRREFEARGKRTQRLFLALLVCYAVLYPALMAWSWSDGDMGGVVLDGLMGVAVFGFTAVVLSKLKKSDREFLTWLAQADAILDELEDETEQMEKGLVSFQQELDIEQAQWSNPQVRR